MRTYQRGIGDYHVKWFPVDKLSPHIPPFHQIPNITDKQKETYEQDFKKYDFYFHSPSPIEGLTGKLELEALKLAKFLYPIFEGILPQEMIYHILTFLWRSEMFTYLERYTG